MGIHFATLTKPIRKRNGRRDLCPGSLSSFVVPSKKGVLAFIQKTRGKERQPELSEPGELSGSKEKER
jgi:hypothetical protein